MICRATSVLWVPFSLGSAYESVWTWLVVMPLYMWYFYFIFVLPAGTVPGEESSPHIHSKAQRLSGSSCNQEGKRDLFPLFVTTSPWASRILCTGETFLPLHGSLCQDLRENSLETNMRRQREKLSFSLEGVFKSAFLRREALPSDGHWGTAMRQCRGVGAQESRPSSGRLVFHVWVRFQRPWKITGLCHPSCALTSCVDAFSSFPAPGLPLAPRRWGENKLTPISTDAPLLQTSPALCGHTIGLHWGLVVRHAAWHSPAGRGRVWDVSGRAVPAKMGKGLLCSKRLFSGWPTATPAFKAARKISGAESPLLFPRVTRERRKAHFS